MYSYLKENYGSGTKLISFAVFIAVVVMISINVFVLIYINGVQARDVPEIFTKYFNPFLAIFNVIILLNGITIHLYLRKSDKKKIFKKIYLFGTTSLFILFSLAFSPILIVGNAMLRIMLWCPSIPKVFIRERWYLLLVFVSILLTIAISKNGIMGYQELVIIFLIIYLTLGLCFCVVPYFLFYSEEKTYFTNFLSHSLLLLFLTSLTLNILGYTIGFGNKEKLFTTVLNFSTIMVAWKRVVDFSNKRKTPEINGEEKKSEKNFKQSGDKKLNYKDAHPTFSNNFLWKKNFKLIFKFIFILFVFVLGVICGKINIGTLINALILNLSKLDLIQIIGFSSLIATLVLFILYFCGKYFIIRQMTNTIFENVVRFDNAPNNLRIKEEYNIGENNSEHIYVYSSDPLRWIKIYECHFNDREKIFIKDKLLVTHGYLRNGYTIKINTYLPCGIPSYIVEYQRYDFITGNLLLAENGKNGIADEGLSTKHTIKSLLYYFIK